MLDTIDSDSKFDLFQKYS